MIPRSIFLVWVPGAICGALMSAECAKAGMHFTDVTLEAGIVHRHSANIVLDQHATFRLFTGGAVAEDFDGDGWIDLFVLGDETAASRLYINQRNGTFSNEADVRGAGLMGLLIGAAAADFDADGDIDLIVTSADAPHHLLINDGSGAFATDSVSVTLPASVATSPSWSDIDNDGDLDLAIGSWTGVTQGGVEPGRIVVYINKGNGQLAAGFSLPNDWNFVPHFADVDGDGDQDLLAVADFGAAAWYRNRGNGTFVRAGSINVDAGMGTASGDIENDGDIDWFISSIHSASTISTGIGTTGNRLFENTGKGGFSDLTTAAGVRDGNWGWGCVLQDLDNDGDLDLYHVNGWHFDMGGPQGGFRKQPALLFENTGNNVFNSIGPSAGDAANTGQGRCVVAFDYDRDGDLDLFIANCSEVDDQAGTFVPGAPALLRNDSPGMGNWVDLRLAGTAPYHPHGMGARIHLTAGGVTQMRELNASSGFNGHGPNRIAHFGIGAATQVSQVRSVWNTGDEVILPTVVLGQEVTIPSPFSSLSSRRIDPGQSVTASIDGGFLPPGAVARWTVDGQTYGNPALIPFPSAGDRELRLEVYEDDSLTTIVRTEVLHLKVEVDELVSKSVARLWNEQNLDAIRIDFPNPTVHARNLFHLSAAMWDCWAAYNESAVGYLHNESGTAPDIEVARREAISRAAYKILKSRYEGSVNGSTTLYSIGLLMEKLGYDPSVTTNVGGTPAALGNRVAETVLGFADSDGWNKANDFLGGGYISRNEAMSVAGRGTIMAEPNHWQPLRFQVAVTQNGQTTDVVQKFLGSHWGGVRPFALALDEGKSVYLDPGPAPELGGTTDAAFKSGNMDVIRFSSHLDPGDGEWIDISPGARGNNPLGTNSGTGHPVNPSTGQPYAANLVKHADFGRVLAEFWADGPESETPPGHWNTLANELTEHPGFQRRIGGVGDEVSPLEWDVKTYFSMNGALHDSAIAAWGCKRVYDFVRPVSSIRYMGGLGQSSDPGGPSYHPKGLPLEAGLVEVVTEESSMPGRRHHHLAEHIGKVAIHAWTHDPSVLPQGVAGVDWILAEDWLPYQRATFVTPAFAGYVSGHSTFSRAAAEVLTRMTGSPYFPDGIGTFTANAHEFLAFEDGPSATVQLQWATFYDAADQAGLSRLYGGIHVPADDGPGRIMGSSCGIGAWDLAIKYFDGSILSEPMRVGITPLADGEFQVSWSTHRGMFYQLRHAEGLAGFAPLLPWERATEVEISQVILPPAGPRPKTAFFQVHRSEVGE